MAKGLDFNSFVQPSLPITFADADRTAINVVAPNVKLIDRLEANLGELKELAKSVNTETVTACYDLAADLMSCNMEHLTLTGDELREKYGVGLVMLIAFISSYLSFIDEIKSEKN